MIDALGRKLPPLRAVNSIHTLFDIIERSTDNMAWLANAGRVMAANRERWAAEDAENERELGLMPADIRALGEIL